MELLLELVKVGLDLLDLDEGWVVQLREEGEGLINGIKGDLVLSGVRLEDLVFLLSLKGLVLKVLTVLSDVVFKLVDGLSKTISLGNEDVVNEVVTVEEVSAGLIDLLLETDGLTVMLVSASVEPGVEVSQFRVEFSDKFVDGFEELLKSTLGLEVEFSEVKNPTSPLRLLDLSKDLLLMVCPNAVSDVH